jgi:conjugative relaxase-like TrwC/TraI family protein
VERGQHGQPEIKGYTKEYLEASSPRRQQIVERLEEQGLRGAGAAQIAAHRTRDSKQPQSIEEVREQHQKLAAEHGNQPQRVMAGCPIHSRPLRMGGRPRTSPASFPTHV